MARIQAVGKYLRIALADLPPSVATTISGASSFSEVSTAPLQTASVMRSLLLSLAADRLDCITASVRSQIVAMMVTASSGYLPLADSPDSMTASVPSRTALVTSPASAR